MLSVKMRVHEKAVVEWIAADPAEAFPYTSSKRMGKPAYELTLPNTPSHP